MQLIQAIPASGGFDINQEHPEFTARRRVWHQYRDLYAGGEQFKQHADRYLVRRQKEPLDVYAERLSRCFYENYIGSIVDWYTATLFRREPVLAFEGNNDRAKQFFGKFIDDCDLKGASITEFFRRQFVEALICGKSYILIDFPKLGQPAGNRAEEDERGASRAYLVSYSADELINWSYDEHGHYEWVVLRTESLRKEKIDDPMWARQVRWVYYDKENYKIYEQTDHGAEHGRVAVTSEGRHGLAKQGRVPVVEMRVPLVGLNPQVSTTGGALPGGRTWYYAVSAVDSNGAESALSFTVMASVPAGTNTNQVTLGSLSFSSGAVSFSAYRGESPAQLLRIANNVAIAAQFVDSGLNATLEGPPDSNFDHANFYWRLELQPNEAADIFSTNTIGNSTLNMLPNDYTGATVRIASGTGAGQEQTIASNSSTTITTMANWGVTPDATSKFLVADSTWQFGATSNASPVSFSVPNREGVTVQISGRAANALDEECAYELSPLTDWRITGAVGDNVDTDVPGVPTFGLSTTGQGTVQISGIGFASLNNTITIAAGTLTLAYWDETNGPSTILLATPIAGTDTALSLVTAVSARTGDLIQMDSEILTVAADVANSTSVPVTRASETTTASAHAAQTGVYFLAKRTFVMPFARDFMGSPASGSYAYPVVIPDVRIAAAELFMTNSQGNGAVGRQALTTTTDLGLRTLSGGQLSIQVEGPLAIQTNAAPAVVMDSTHSVRDVYAVAGEAPTGAPVSMQITQNSQPYCQLTIPVNATMSNVVDGFALGPLLAQAQIGLDITAVTASSGVQPGSDLTVTIRL